MRKGLLSEHIPLTERKRHVPPETLNIVTNIDSNRFNSPKFKLDTSVLMSAEQTVTNYYLHLIESDFDRATRENQKSEQNPTEH